MVQNRYSSFMNKTPFGKELLRVLVIIVLGYSAKPNPMQLRCIHLDHIPHVVVKNKVNNNYTAFQYKGSSLIGEDFISPLFDWSPI